MSGPSGFAGGLAFLPNWLTETAESAAFDPLFATWVRASGWKGGGLVWPADGKPTLSVVVRPDGCVESAPPPPELGEPLRALQGGSPTVVWQLPGTSGRLYTRLQPAGRPAGLVWVERGGTDPWADADRNYLVLSARLIERAPALAAKIGPLIDSERLNQRLTDAALIAGRMAHDFDNVLTGIIGFADLTVPLVATLPQPSKFVSEIGKVGQRGIVFTQQLHQLSRSAQVKPQPAVVPTVVAKEEARLRPQTPAGLHVSTALPADLPQVGMDAGPLGQVIGHLLENAIEACPPTGRVAVSAREVEVSATDARAYLGRVTPGPHVELTVQDSGSGIKPEVRAKLFAEPFFTTKVRHRGLGLAVVFRTLYAHGGGIRIEPAAPPDAGTVVRVVLPPGVVRPPVTTTPPVSTATIIRG